MLTGFLGRSRVRRDILSIFFSNPDSHYYQRQLEKLLGHPVSAIRREILRLEREGLLSRSREANVVFFQAQRAHPLYNEVSSIVTKTVGIPGLIRDGLKREKGIAGALIFGSYSRFLSNEPNILWTAQSDIDLLVVGDVDLGMISLKLQPLEKRFGHSIGPTLYTVQEFLARLKSRDDFLSDLFSHDVIPLIGTGTFEILGPRRIRLEEMEASLRGS
jgi:predicted nucleotidyltransferase